MTQLSEGKLFYEGLFTPRLFSIDAKKRPIGLYRRDLYTDTVSSIRVWRQKSRINFSVNGYPTCVDTSSATFHRTQFGLDPDAWNQFWPQSIFVEVDVTTIAFDRSEKAIDRR